MVKLSELENDTMLIYKAKYEYPETISVEILKAKLDEYRGISFLIGDPNPGELDARHMIKREIYYQCQMMHENWEDVIRDSIEETDIEELQDILDRIIERAGSGNITYEYGELVEIDL